MENAEIDYYLSKWVMLNLCKNKVITKKQYLKTLRLLVEKYNPQTACFENLIDSVGFSEGGKGDRMLMAKNLYCGKCGNTYLPRMWHSTTYNNQVWQCRSITKKGCYCHNTHVYDEMLGKAINTAMIDRLENKRTIFMDCLSVLSKTKAIIPQGAHTKIDWIYYRAPDIFRMAKSIIVTKDRRINIHFNDGLIFKYDMPEYTPGKKGAAL